jgi:hypothetical protein
MRARSRHRLTSGGRLGVLRRGRKIGRP